MVVSENLPLFILEKIIFRTKVQCNGIFYGNVLSMQGVPRKLQKRQGMGLKQKCLPYVGGGWV